MKRNIQFYGLIFTLLTSSAMFFASQQQCQTHAKQVKMDKLRQHPNFNSKATSNQIQEELNYGKEISRQGGASYFSNQKFEQASKDAKIINGNSTNNDK